ncbi:anti-sigma-factor antagonist [Pseudomonas putida S11]|nr:anti-sigma-factor antagonist [Pseudomonas putida S11]
MSTGRIQFAEQSGTFVLKFVGEVRLTLCSALDATIEKIFTALNFSAIVIDLTETESIDSTTLGLLAKLSILSRQKVGLLPTVVTTNPGHFPVVAVDGLRSGVQHRRSADPVSGMPDRPAIPRPERRCGALQGAGGAQDPHGPERLQPRSLP